MFKKDHFNRRLWMCVLGVCIAGVSVGLFKISMFGVDPFQSFMAGLDTLVPISFGTLYVIANAILLCFSLIFDRHYIGIATFINLFLLGYITQFTFEFLQKSFPDLGFGGRLIFLLIGIVIICFSSSLYFTADLGVSTYDAVALIITETWKKGEFRWVRIITDLTCVTLGIILYLMSGEAFGGIFTFLGLGTIISAFGMGPLIDFFNEKFAKPMLYR